MKRILLLFVLATVISNVYSQVSISTDGSSPNASAMLDIISTEKGLLIPRMTLTERDVINLPADGLLIYQTDNTPGFYFYDGSSWIIVTSGNMEINKLTDGKTGGNSVFIGSGAGVNDDGSNNQNVAVGIDALNTNTTGYNNTAIGYNALVSNLTGMYNTANGFDALKNNTGSYNTAIGSEALYHNLNGYGNSAFGSNALRHNSTGKYNVALGYFANYNSQEGNNNTIIGYEAGKGYVSHSKSGNIFLGYQAGFSEYGDNKLYIENSNSSSPLIYGEFDNKLLKFNSAVELANGSSASSLKFYEPSGSGSNFTKFQSRSQSTDVTYTLPAADGISGQVLQTDGSGILSWNNDVGATQINNLTDGKTGGNSVFLGSGAGSNDDGSTNQNVAVGIDALNTNTAGGYNTAIGFQTLHYNTENSNTAIGYRALYSNRTGSCNTANGMKANYYNYYGSNNTIIGFEAGMGPSTHNKSGNIFLGYQAGYNETGDNKLYIENSNSSSPLIYGEFDNKLLKFNGALELANGSSASSLKFYEPSSSGSNFTKFQSQAQAGDVTYTLPAADGISGQVLQTDGSGILSWNNDVGATQINGLTDGKTGGSSVFLGSGAGANDDGTDNQNVAVGNNASRMNIAGCNNTATGYFTSYSNTTGSSNTANGYCANYYNKEGSNNTIVGYKAGMGSALHNKSGNVFLGFMAGYNATANNKLYIENSNSAAPLIYGDFGADLITIYGNLGLSTKVFGGGTRTLAMVNGVAPTSSITDGILLFSQNLNFSSELRVRDEAGNITTLSPHNFSMTNKSEPMAWSYYSENSEMGKKINVDMLKAIRLIEEMTGEKLAYVQNIEDDADNINIEENTIGIIQQQQQDIDELKKLNAALLLRIEKLENE